MVYTIWYIPVAIWYIPSKTGIYHEARFQMMMAGGYHDAARPAGAAGQRLAGGHPA